MIYSEFLKRTFDLIIAIPVLLLVSPFILLAILAIFFEDRKTPFYIPKRIGKDFKPFNMMKLRSMVIEADKTGVDSTSKDDPRITKVGKFIRAAKLDEFMQLVNVIKGEMSLVGPRPNVHREVRLYTDTEKKLLSVKPGITDPSSIIFSDLADILNGNENPDLTYNQLVRPWKSSISIFYLDNRSFCSDFLILLLTFINFINRKLALRGLQLVLKKMGASAEMSEFAERSGKLKQSIPPGASKVVSSRD